MRKPKPIERKYAYACVHKDKFGSHVHLDIQSSTIKQTKKLIKWLQQAIRYLEQK